MSEEQKSVMWTERDALTFGRDAVGLGISYGWLGEGVKGATIEVEVATALGVLALLESYTEGKPLLDALKEKGVSKKDFCDHLAGVIALVVAQHGIDLPQDPPSPIVLPQIKLVY